MAKLSICKINISGELGEAGRERERKRKKGRKRAHYSERGPEDREAYTGN